MNAVRSIVRHFRQERRGTVAVSFALAAVPLLGLIGVAIDLNSAMRMRVQLNAAADVAALTTVSNTNRILSAAVAEQRGTEAFQAFVAAMSIAPTATVKVSVSDSVTERSVTVSYTASYTSLFINAFGASALEVSGSASATGPLSPYVDFYLLLDNSPSMGLGATQADIDKLVNNTSDKCAFACHQMDKPTSDYYTLAKKIGVQMRIDVVRQATQSLIDTATNARLKSEQFQMAVYTFGQKAEEIGLKEVAGISSDLVSVKTKSGSIDLMTIPYANYRGDTQTDFDKIFSDIEAKIGVAGDGATSANPQKILYFVSDGVNDAEKGTCSRTLVNSQDPKTKYSHTRCQEPLNPTLCENIKKKGVKIAVLYTTYFPLPTNGWYNSYIKPFQSTIATNMKSCASDGLYFEVSPSQGIAEAMNALFVKALAQVRLTR